MKTKALLLFGLIALGQFAWGTQAMNSVPEPAPINKSDIEDPPPGYEKINLQGSLMYGIGPNTVVAGASDDAVYIGFNEDLGNVNITIYNGMGGVVYSTVVNSGVQSVVIIPFSGVASGSYIVELNNANGYADGDFEHD